ncbi:MAG: DNA repair protein RecN [Candidatus Aminicenantes bacterium]
MIKSLRIRNLATIADVDIRLEKGFTVLTGETGAGKSIIIDAIRLLMGDRGSPGLVRTGMKESSVEAVFDVAGRSLDWAGLPEPEGGELFVQRTVSEQGPGRAWINGVLVPLRRLRELAPSFVDVYGQNDHIFLLHTDNHLAFLDEALEDPELALGTAYAARELRRLLLEKRDLEARKKEREQRLDFVDFQVREIEGARLRPGEDTELLREREMLKNTERIAGLVDRALDLAYHREDSLLSLLARLRSTLGELSDYDPALGEFQRDLEGSSILLRDVSDSLVRFKDRRSEVPDDPEALEERLNAIEKLKRKYGATVEAVLDHLEGLRAEAASLAGGQDRLQDLEAEVREKFERFTALAGRLGGARASAAERLERLIEKEIAQLGMKKARFKIDLTGMLPVLDDPATFRDRGTEDAEFLLSPNPGEELRPLRRIASGGELSRMMLALKSVGRDRDGPKTLIFDEIDSGIGGRTAGFIADKLQRLAARHQVLCITHLPQIASRAAHHLRVEKKMEKQRTFTGVSRLEHEDRLIEIARLIAGARITEASLQTAREMLDDTTERTEP